MKTSLYAKVSFVCVIISFIGGCGKNSSMEAKDASNGDSPTPINQQGSYSVFTPGQPSAKISSSDGGLRYSGEIFLTIPGQSEWDYFGKVVAGGADFDGDGVADIVAGLPWHWVDFGDGNGAQANVGRVEIYSGADGHLIRAKDGQKYGGFFGAYLSLSKTHSNQGVPNVYVVSQGQDSPTDKIMQSMNVSFGAAIDVFSGVDLSWIANQGYSDTCSGSACQPVWGPGYGTQYEHSFAELGDLDDDGSADTIYGNPGYSGGSSPGNPYANQAGEVFLITGESPPSRIARYSENTTNGFFGRSVAGIGDVNNDGVPDYIAGEPGYDNSRGRVFVMSGKTHQPIYEWQGEDQGDFFGTSVDSGDFDGDGVPDVIIGAPLANLYLIGNPKWIANQSIGRVYIFSGKTGYLIAIIDGQRIEQSFGCSVANGGRGKNETADRIIVGSHGGCVGLSISGDPGSIAMFRLEGRN